MACLWLRGLPSQPLPCKGLLGSGLITWPGPECIPYVCVGLEAQCPREIFPPVLAKGHLKVSTFTLLARILQGKSPSCLADPTPRVTVGPNYSY